MYVAFTPLLLVFAASAMTTGQDRIHQQPAALQEWKCSFMDKCCPAGTHVSEDGKKCINCINGEDYTFYWNKLSSCLPCTICKSDKEVRVPCTRTENTQCQCKPGTFHDEDFPEVCQKCSTGCPDGMVEAEPCTPWSDRKCLKQTPGSSQLVIGIAAVSVSVLVVLVLIAYACACYHRRRILQGCGGDPECLNTVCFQCPRSLRKPGALDNACNEIMSNKESVSSLTSEQELRPQEHPQLAGGQSPEAEAKHLLGSAGPEVSQMRRRRLVPADGAEPIKSLRKCFDDLPRYVPFNSWERFMRQVGLEPNEICVAKARACDPREALHEMLVTWLNRNGQDASVNTLLDALDTLGEKDALESIEGHLVGSGNYVYEEGGAGSAVL